MTSTSTLFIKNGFYNRLARKIAIANLGGPVKRKKIHEGKENVLRYSNSYFYHSFIIIIIIIIIIITTEENEKEIDGEFESI